MVNDLFFYEKEMHAQGYRAVCGADEAGRGPLAGPVCAAAVLLPDTVEIEGLNDSKKLSEKKRESLYPIILEKAIAYSIQMVDEDVIDKINILNASLLAMKRAIEQLGVLVDCALIDGNRLPQLHIPARAIVKGDGLSASIMAASILAKVTRDRFMIEMDRRYPQYGFAQHKGYPTKLHYQRVADYGLCPIHRKTFFKNHPELL